MLRGQVAVFLSCSEKFKPKLAWPVRDALAAEGLYAIIVADEPPLPDPDPGGVGGDAEGRAEPYLDASSAFVALCTADYELSDGSQYPRANIIDEIQQASARPHLRDRSQVLKAPGVLLPSDITPTYDALDVARPAAAAEVIWAQLQRWGIGPASLPAAPSAGTAGDVETLFVGLRPGEHDEARRRVYPLLRDRDSDQRRRLVRELHRQITESEDSDRALAAASLLEAAWRLDTALVPGEMIEALAAHPRYPARSCAANLLRRRAAVAPLDVPIEVLGRLAAPRAEDWLVWAPAMAAVQELVQQRRDAQVILESLAASADPQDRHAAAVALLGVAAADPAAAAAALAEQLAGDRDPLVAAKAREIITVIEQAAVPDRARRHGEDRAENSSQAGP
jgi:DNA alkylation repair enzyme